MALMRGELSYLEIFKLLGKFTFYFLKESNVKAKVIELTKVFRILLSSSDVYETIV